jgi:hypothetical protein
MGTSEINGHSAPSTVQLIDEDCSFKSPSLSNPY